MAAAQRRGQCAHLLGGEVAHLGFDDLALGGATGGGGEVLADRQRAAEEVEELAVGRQAGADVRADALEQSVQLGARRLARVVAPALLARRVRRRRTRRRAARAGDERGGRRGQRRRRERRRRRHVACGRLGDGGREEAIPRLYQVLQRRPLLRPRRGERGADERRQARGEALLVRRADVLADRVGEVDVRHLPLGRLRADVRLDRAHDRRRAHALQVVRHHRERVDQRLRVEGELAELLDVVGEGVVRLVRHGCGAGDAGRNCGAQRAARAASTRRPPGEGSKAERTEASISADARRRRRGAPTTCVEPSTRRRIALPPPARRAPRNPPLPPRRRDRRGQAPPAQQLRRPGRAHGSRRRGAAAASTRCPTAASSPARTSARAASSPSCC